MFFTKRPVEIPNSKNALPGRDYEIETASKHFVLNTPIKGPIPEGFSEAMFGMGCFWGVERIFWNIEGVFGLLRLAMQQGIHPMQHMKKYVLG